MNDTITQDNLYLLLPFKISYMAVMLKEDRNISLIEAIRQIYSSETYKRLEREESKAWNLGPATLYYDLTHESRKD
ncbi:MAG: hypothetical protein NC410_03555 [Oscillibacter sp.]|nr:hypothetical protein [Oscillibacter sp.]